MYLPESANLNCGIYRIKNMRNGKFYVGSSKNLKARKKTHFNDLKNNKHHCDHLQNAWNAEDDKSVFEFQIFIYCKSDQLISMEQGCIDFMRPTYNTNSTAGQPPVMVGEANPMFKNGEKSSFFGKPAWNRGLPKELQPGYGKPGSMRGRKGSDHPAYGKPSWNKNQAWSEQAKLNISKAKIGKSLPKKSLLTEAQALEILTSNEGTLLLATKYGVSQQVVADLRMNKTWRHLPRSKVWTRSELQKLGWTPDKRKKQSEYVQGSRHRDSKLTEEQVLEIRSSSLRHVDLAAKYGVSACNILGIRKGETWKHLLPKENSPRAEEETPLDWPSRVSPPVDTDKS